MRAYPPVNRRLLSEAASYAAEEILAQFPQLQEWINGDRKPTVNQLAVFSKAVHIPFGFFFLDELPKIINTIPLFRSGSAKPRFDYSYELSETIQTIHRRQEWLVEFHRSEHHEKLPFVGSFSTKNDHLTIANDIRKVLKLDMGWSRGLQNKDAAFKYVINQAEDSGMYVAVSGVVGNSSKNLNAEEFKGFILANDWAPYIFINGKDYPGPKLFTLMHEIAHVWVDRSAAFDIERLQPANTDLEILCDAVAAELLVPQSLLTRHWNAVSKDPRHLDQLERIFKVSKVVIARRLMDLGFYSKSRFYEFYQIYKAYWESKAQSSEGGSFYANQSYRVGRKFFNTVDKATQSGKLLYTDAYQLTNLYGNTFHQFKNYLDN